MAKKFGKLLLVSAAIGSAIGAVYYFARKKDAERDSAKRMRRKAIPAAMSP